MILYIYLSTNPAFYRLCIKVGWIWNRLEKGQKGSLPNGILYLKGGDLAEELALTGKRWHVYDIPRFFGEEFFETKKVVYTPR